MKLKKGDRVLCTGPGATSKLQVTNKAGTVLSNGNAESVSSVSVLVEFDEDIRGHDGSHGSSKARGKDGHCYYLQASCLVPGVAITTKQAIKQAIHTIGGQ